MEWPKPVMTWSILKTAAPLLDILYPYIANNLHIPVLAQYIKCIPIKYFYIVWFIMKTLCISFE